MDKRQELIGKTLTITNSTNKDNIGLQGKIIDETKWMLTIQTNKGTKKIKKTENEIEINNNGRRIQGESISHTPEERIKLK